MNEPLSEDPFMLQIRRRNRRILTATILVFVVPLLFVTRSCAVSASHDYRNFEKRFTDPESFEHPLTAAQAETIRASVDAVRARADEAKKSWRAAMDAAIASGLTERADLGACPLRAVSNGPTQDPFPAPPAWLTIAKIPGEAATASPATWASHDREATSITDRARRGQTDRDAARLVAEAQAFARETRFTWDVLVVLDKRVDATDLGAEKGFISGEVDGRAYLFDYGSGKVACAGHLHAENSDEVRFKYTARLGDSHPTSGVEAGRRALDRDLDLETFRAAAEAVRFRAGPPLPPQDP